MSLITIFDVQAVDGSRDPGESSTPMGSQTTPLDGEFNGLAWLPGFF